MRFIRLRDVLSTIIVSAQLLNFAFSQTNVLEYRDKIKSDKEYEIQGQDILNVIYTIDRLENTIDSLCNSKIERISDTVYIVSELNSIDTVYSTVHDTVYISQISAKTSKMYEDYMFHVLFVAILCLAVWLKLKGKNK